MKLTTDLIKKAQADSPWDTGNNVLYSLCRTHPKHINTDEVVAKIWLIGRSYAAAIERRRNADAYDGDFYLDKVAPPIIESDIDAWIHTAAHTGELVDASLPTSLFVHQQVTSLFNRISGLEKRSLGSKYLHFHLPHFFFIYDSRAVRGISKLATVVGRATQMNTQADREYKKFAAKCLRLQRHISNEFGVSLSPRQIDNLLLEIC